VVGTLSAGDVVEVFSREDGWARISPPEGFCAYVSAQFAAAGKISGSRVNYRSGPGLSYARLGQLNEGDAIQVLEETGDWLKFPMPPVVRLWVSSGLLEEVVPPEMVPEVREGGGLPLPVVPSGTPWPMPSPFSTPPVTMSSRPRVFTKIGYVRSLPESRRVDGREVGFQLVEQRPASGVLAWLCSESIELSRYCDRRVRIYALELEVSQPWPLLEVKGLQVLW